MSDFMVILVVGVGTYFTRSVFILALANRTIPPRVLAALDFVGPSVLSALVVALLILPDGSLDVGWIELVALSVAALVVHRWRNLLYAGVSGMVTFWLLSAFF